MNQVKNSLFDPVTICKVLKSLLLSLLSGASAFCVVYVTTENWKISLAAGGAAMLAPFGTNTAIEYRKGVDPKLPPSE